LSTAGKAAWLAGHVDQETYRGGVTWSRTRIKSWEHGWDAATAGVPEPQWPEPAFQCGDHVDFGGHGSFLSEGVIVAVSKDGMWVDVATAGGAYRHRVLTEKVVRVHLEGKA
jgi:hypothetical protein